MTCFIYFTPVLLFISLFVGSGIYFTFTGLENPFYQFSPLVAIIPAIALGWALHKGTTEQRMTAFLDGVRHRDIVTMCLIFLLAGAFSELTKAIGSIDCIVNLALSLLNPQYLLIGLFLTSALISTAIGTSMGTIATIAPIAAGLSVQTGADASLLAATVIGGAMFGDNLSVISDTTIAAVMSQKADIKAKLKLNAKIAVIASVITIVVLFNVTENINSVQSVKGYSLLLIAPYFFLLTLAISGVNVFITLCSSIAFAAIIGFISNNDLGLLFISQSITKGFASVHEIMLLSLMVGGLSGLSNHGSKELANNVASWIKALNGGQKMAQLFIAKIVSVFDILLANNTIAIIFSGEIARSIAQKYKIPPHYSATWLGVFSCVFQGIIPYGAQILLASTIAGVSPLAITPQVYYCYILAIIAVCYILFNKISDNAKY